MQRNAEQFATAKSQSILRSDGWFCRKRPNRPATTSSNAASAAIPRPFAPFSERHKDKVYSIALRYTGDAAAAEDIAQETFIKLFSAIEGFRGASKFESWLYRLVVNCCFDHKRKSRRLLPLLDNLRASLRSPATGTLDNLLRTELSGQVQAAVLALTPDQRIVIVLRYTQGLAYDEIAEILGASIGTIASRLSRAHKILERRLSHLAAKAVKGNEHV